MTVGTLRTPLAILVEVAWAYAAVAVFVRIFGQGDGPAPSFLLVALVVVGSFLLAKLLQATDVDETMMRVVGVAVTVAVLYLALRIEYAPDQWPLDIRWIGDLLTDTRDVIRPNGNVIAGIFALTPLWLRGVLRAQDSTLQFEDILGSASLGLVAVLLAAIAQPDTREPASWGAFAFAYCVLALFALAVAQWPQPDTPLATFTRRWGSPFAALAGVAFLVALFAAAIDPGTFGALEPVFAPLRVARDAVGTYVLEPILQILLLPFRAVFFLLDRVLPENRRELQQMQQSPAEKPQVDKEHPLWARILMIVAGSFAMAIVALIALAVLWFAFRRFARRKPADDRERHEDLEPASSLTDDLAAMWAALGRRLRRNPQSRSAIAIRRLYADVLETATANGLERPPATTPSQFAPRLAAHFHSDVPVLISDAFVESRYGARAIDDARVAELRGAWRALSRTN